MRKTVTLCVFQLAFVNMNSEGSSMLNVLTPEHIIDARDGKQRKTARLADLIGQLKHGNPGLAPFKESKAQMAVPG